MLRGSFLEEVTFYPMQRNGTCKGPVAYWRNQGRLLGLEHQRRRENDMVREVRGTRTHRP